jgi:hypothetical protein
MSKTAKIFSAAVIAVALVATVTVAKTIHPLTAATEVDRTVGTTGMAPRDSAPAFGQRGLACGMTLAASCDTLQMILPE